MSKYVLLTLLACLFVACGSTFTYRYYGLQLKEYNGALLAPKKADYPDLDAKECQPDDVVKGKCIVMLSAEFYRLKADKEKLQEQVKYYEDHCGTP